jgi:prepilin-type N-terminal cleavage/methylation domain-containing protein
MRRALRAPGRGFTLLELIVVICLVAILLTVAFDRMLRYLELAEKAAMESTVGALQSALHLQLGALYVKGGAQATAELAEANPFDWLSQRPQQYVGVRPDVEPGSWYYDPGAREVVYRPQRTRFLVRPRPEVDPRIRFRVEVALLQPEGATGLRGLAGVGLAPVTPYVWQAGDVLNPP